VAQWINGIELAKEIQAEVAAEVRRLQQSGNQPALAVVLVGDNPASQVYVRGKVRTCRELGMHSEKIELPGTATTDEILAVVEGLNRRPDIHGILVQVPLPPQVASRRILESIDPQKDVDGFHPFNVGRLVAGNAVLKPCTPSGIMEIFRRYKIPLRGRRAVVIGRSDIVGKPISLMLLHEDVTVTICHSKTRDLPQVAREADILIAALGKPALIDDEYVKPGAVVIDVGVNRVDSLPRIREIFGADPQRLADHARRGYVLVGDVHPAKVLPKASFLTPVPGGVGPLTVAMLMSNTVRAAASLANVPVLSESGELR
jgi:methylenetetrahydrofolate dehydrogenase (NADP+)/methenyltetrahydrofolate cyclohydrolase